MIEPMQEAHSKTSSGGSSAPDVDSEALELRLEELLSDQRVWLRRTVSRLCPHHLGVQVEEIEQEVRVRLWRALQRQDAPRSPVSYLYRVATTATIDAIRRVQARREDQLEPPTDEEVKMTPNTLRDVRATPEDAAVARSVLEAVERCIDELPENRRLAVKLHLQGFNSTEIGAFLDWTEAKARNLVSRGMRSLRDELLRRGVRHADARI